METHLYHGFRLRLDHVFHPSQSHQSLQLLDQTHIFLHYHHLRHHLLPLLSFPHQFRHQLLLTAPRRFQYLLCIFLLSIPTQWVSAPDLWSLSIAFVLDNKYSAENPRMTKCFVHSDHCDGLHNEPSSCPGFLLLSFDCNTTIFIIRFFVLALFS